MKYLEIRYFHHSHNNITAEIVISTWHSAQELRDLIVFTTVVQQSRCHVEHRLQTIHQTPCDAVECEAAVVES